MTKINVTVVTIGHMPAIFDKKKIKNWKSDLFTIEGNVENHTLPTNSDGENWTYTDKNLIGSLPDKFQGHFLVAIVSVPIELNWYSRRLGNNKIIFTFHEIKEILNHSNIPLENAVYRLLYTYVLLFKGNSEIFQLANPTLPPNFPHDETRGCLYDMHGIKSDIIYSCHNPIICDSCVQALQNNKVSKEVIEKAKKEIAKIKKPLFYRMADFVKRRPICSLLVSALAAIILGAIGSYISSLIYAHFYPVP